MTRVSKPGDEIRTGRNGRVLLVRGQESILVSPNSVISLPPEETEQKDGLSTTILQQAGSILLEVEKRAVKHFEVETPYLAAVVKGTQFRVSVNKDDSSVDVLRGEVEVAGFKSGQYTTVRPGQAARVATEGRGDLSLSGSGTLSPIQQGEPHQSSITPIPVPQEGLSAPASAPNGQQVRVVPAARRNWIERRAVGRARRSAPACLGHLDPHPAKPVPSVIGGPATWSLNRAFRSRAARRVDSRSV